MISRRELLKSLAAGVAAGSGEPILQATRFLMKDEFPRVEVAAPSYRFHAHGRFFGFRLAVPPFDERITYTDFGSFQCGGVDLVCAHYHNLALRDDRGNQISMTEGRLSLPSRNREHMPVFGMDYRDATGCRLGAVFHFQSSAPHVIMRFEPAGFSNGEELTLVLPGNWVFDRHCQGRAWASYFSSGLKVGLLVQSTEPGSVAAGTTPVGKQITCRIPTDRASHWGLTILGTDGPTSAEFSPVKTPPMDPVRTSSLPEWEVQTMDARGWKPSRARAKERIAGLFVSAAGWRQPVSWLPESRIAYLERTLLPKIAAVRCFDAIGLSRDGITEQGENAEWLRLVGAAHRGGFRVHMKPGDGELTAIRSQDGISAWAKSCFDCPADHRCDVVRLPGEAVLVPWTTANLCLDPRFMPQELRNLFGMNWKQVSQRIVSAVADRFSRVIDSIRRYAPSLTVDLECCDSRVLEVLLSRHENLGVMYMTYGQYPRAAHYLDLYECVAGLQMKAKRVVLETDCYYSHSVTGLGQLKSKPYPELYSQDDLRLMAEKHRYMRGLAADAVWAWGLNIAFTEAKFRAICDAYS